MGIRGRGQRHFVVFILALVLLVTYLHYSTIPEIRALHGIYEDLYEVPILLAAFLFGIKGGMLTYVFILIVYMPYILMTWAGATLFLTENLLRIVLFGVTGLLAGFLVDRERRHREHSERDRYLAGLGRAATSIAHDLRNPLTTVTAFARRIQEEKGDAKDNAETIAASAGVMRNIVSDVLDFARPIALSVKEEDMRGVITRAAEACRLKADGEEVALAVDLPSAPVPAPVDGVRIERALVNLITNAIDASGRRQAVAVGAAAGAEHVSIRIKDNGPGMDEETLENVFIPFYTRKQAGTGLGMAIAKRIIEEHGGKIRLKSQRGTGTEVVVELPYRCLRQTRGP